MFLWVNSAFYVHTLLPTAQAVKQCAVGYGEPGDAVRKVGNGPALLILFIAQFLWAPPYAVV